MRRPDSISPVRLRKKSHWRLYPKLPLSFGSDAVVSCVNAAVMLAAASPSRTSKPPSLLLKPRQIFGRVDVDLTFRERQQVNFPKMSLNDLPRAASALELHQFGKMGSTK